MAYDAAHQLKTKTDPMGRQSRTAYDANGRTTWSETDIDRAAARSQRTTMYYDLRGLTTRQVEVFDNGTGRELTTITQYDQDGREILTASPRAVDADGGAGSYTQFATRKIYDANGQMTRSEQPSKSGEEKSYVHAAYDKLGRTLWTSMPTTETDPAAVSDIAKTENTYYDPGWIRTLGKNANPALLFDYNAMGQQTSRLPAKPGTADDWNYARRTQWTYTPDGQKSSMTDYQGGVTTWEYDLHDNIVTAYDPAGQSVGFDAAVATRATYNGFDEATETSYKRDDESNWKYTELHLRQGRSDRGPARERRARRGRRAGQAAEADRADLRPERLHDPPAQPGHDLGLRRRRADRHHLLRHRVGAGAHAAPGQAGLWRGLLDVGRAADHELDALRERQAAHADDQGRQRPHDRGAHRRLPGIGSLRGRQPRHRQLPAPPLGDVGRHRR